MSLSYEVIKPHIPISSFTNEEWWPLLDLSLSLSGVTFYICQYLSIFLCAVLSLSYEIVRPHIVLSSFANYEEEWWPLLDFVARASRGSPFIYVNICQ